MYFIGYMVCKYSLPFFRLPFHFVDCFLCERKLFSLMLTHLFILFLLPGFWCHIKKKIIGQTNVRMIFSMLSPESLTVADLTFKSLIHFELIFVSRA